MNNLSTLRPKILVLSLLCAAMGTAQAGLREGLEAYHAGEYARGYRDIEVAAEAGNPMAQGMLGSYYSRGLGSPIDKKKALYWLTLAAEANDLRGLVTLANFYYRVERGEKPDCAKAHDLAMRAVEQNSVSAYQLLAELYGSDFCGMQDTDEAIKWATKAAEMGDARNAEYVGLYYWEAKDKNGNGFRDEAYKWLLFAANQGHAHSMASVAMFNLGHGRPKDLVSTIVWLRLAQKPPHDADRNRGDIEALNRKWSVNLTPAQAQEVDRRVAEFVPQHLLQDRYEQHFQKLMAEATRWDLLHPTK